MTQEIVSLINRLSPDWLASNLDSINKLSQEHLFLLGRILRYELNSETAFREVESTPAEFNLNSLI